MLSKACIVGIYQRKLEAIAQQGIELLTLVPPAWKDERGVTPLERVYTGGYQLQAIPIRLNGNFHLHHYPTLGYWMQRFRPHIVHIDEEPYNLASWQALYHARRTGAKSLFFSWQNINRAYPPPFSWGERWVLNTVAYGLMGTESAAQVWREKGYTGPLAVVPQFGTDPDLFQPTDAPPPKRPFTIGYVGRLVEEKGIHHLLQAAAQLQGDWRLRLIGSGPYKPALLALAADLGMIPRIDWVEWIASTEMPLQYHTFDVLTIPSLTRANWKEQFGRVITEAMASGVPVIGTDSGAIPDVIGDAGMIVPEGRIDALRSALDQLRCDAEVRTRLAHAGRARVLARFTHQQVASDTVRVYQEIVKSQSSLNAQTPA